MWERMLEDVSGDPIILFRSYLLQGFGPLLWMILHIISRNTYFGELELIFPRNEGLTERASCERLWKRAHAATMWRWISMTTFASSLTASPKVDKRDRLLVPLACSLNVQCDLLELGADHRDMDFSFFSDTIDSNS